jgi:hypothetical protein
MKRGIAAKTKLEVLYAQNPKKFDHVCAVLAREFGYGELSTLSEEDRNRVEDEAEQYVQQWEETVEMKTSPTIRPITPLGRLLAEYHDICERILDEHEIDAGLWGLPEKSPEAPASSVSLNSGSTKRQRASASAGALPILLRG